MNQICESAISCCDKVFVKSWKPFLLSFSFWIKRNLLGSFNIYLFPIILSLSFFLIDNEINFIWSLFYFNNQIGYNMIVHKLFTFH